MLPMNTTSIIFNTGLDVYIIIANSIICGPTIVIHSHIIAICMMIQFYAPLESHLKKSVEEDRR